MDNLIETLAKVLIFDSWEIAIFVTKNDNNTKHNLIYELLATWSVIFYNELQSQIQSPAT